jgi:putative phosphoribosyl transferase
MLDDRTEAGKKLGEALMHYTSPHTMLLAIPRGGVRVGYEAAKVLGAQLSLIISRKLPLPWNTEGGFGAVAEDGSTWLVPGYEAQISGEVAAKTIADQKEEIRRRIQVLRGGRDLPDIRDRTVILVDDGIAVGSTMRASIACCRNLGAGKVVVAAPVTGSDTAREMKKIADDVVILEIPSRFRAVAQVYLNWYDVSDEEVLQIMKEAEQRVKGRG